MSRTRIGGPQDTAIPSVGDLGAHPSDAASASRYCFGGNRDCGGETWIGLDDSWAEGCARCCAGFGSGVWTGLSAEGEDESF